MKENKYRFYNLDIKTSFGSFIETLYKDNEVNDSGIELNFKDVSNESIVFDFVERKSKAQMLQLENGEVAEFNVINICVTEIRILKISEGLCLIILVNPKSSMKTISSYLKSKNEKRIVFSSISIDIKEVLKNAKKERDIDLISVPYVKVSGIFLGAHSMAKIEIDSKKDALSTVKNHFDSNDFLVERCRFIFRISNEEIEATFSRVGIVAINCDINAQIISLIIGKRL